MSKESEKLIRKSLTYGKFEDYDEEEEEIKDYDNKEKPKEVPKKCNYLLNYLVNTK